MHQLLNLILGIPTVSAQANTAAKTGESTFDILGFVLSNLPLWITAIIVFFGSMVLGAMLKRVVENRMAAKITEEHQEILIISGRLTFVGMVVIGATISLAIAGINVTNLIAAIGFGISFGLQDTIANFVAGIALLASRPFTIGDWIKVDGMMGKVTEIRTRATYLNTFDGLRLIVPNSQLYKSQVLSYTSNPMRRIKVSASTRYGADMKQAFTIILNTVKSHNNILLQPKPNVVISEFGDYYIGLEVRFWVDSKALWRRIQSKLSLEIQQKFSAAGISPPYPTTNLTFDTDDDEMFVKTKNLDAEEVGKIMKMRAESESESAKKREQFAAPLFKAMEEQKILDQSGTTFLKVTTMPLPAVSQQDTAAFPPNSPQATLPQDSQKAAAEAIQQVGTPTAFNPKQADPGAASAGAPIPDEPVNPPNQP